MTPLDTAAKAAAEEKRWTGCPCCYTTPCQERCSCVSYGSSHGCLRCCTHGSMDQRVRRADSLASLDAALADARAENKRLSAIMKKLREWRDIIHERNTQNTGIQVVLRIAADEIMDIVEDRLQAAASKELK